MRPFIIAIVLLLLNLGSNAAKKNPAEKAKAKTDTMQKDLALTADQYTKIYDVNLKAFTSIAEYEAKKPGKKLKKKQKQIVQDLREDQFKKILSAAQYKTYLKLKKEEKEEEKAKEKEEEKKLEKLKPNPKK